MLTLLTKFSIFFGPIGFLATVYGMNFDVIPETKFTADYFIFLSLLVVMILILFIHLKRKFADLI
jgi:magnesium transporter